MAFKENLSLYKKYTFFFLYSFISLFVFLRELVVAFLRGKEMYILDVDDWDISMYSLFFYSRRANASTPSIPKSEQPPNLQSLIFQFNELYPDVSNVWAGWIGVSGSRNLYINFSSLKNIPEYYWFSDYIESHSMVNKKAFTADRNFYPMFTFGILNWYLRRNKQLIPSYRLLNKFFK